MHPPIRQVLLITWYQQGRLSPRYQCFMASSAKGPWLYRPVLKTSQKEGRVSLSQVAEKLSGNG